MNYLIYRDILEKYQDMDNLRQRKLLSIYSHIPSLPRLRAMQALLIELKQTSVEN